MGNGHMRPRDVSGESCLTFTNTLVPYILSLIYAVPRVYRLSPTHSCHIYISVLMYTLPRGHGVSPIHSCRIMCLICMVPRVHGVSQTHSYCYGALAMCMIGCAGPPTPSKIRMYHTMVAAPAFLAIITIGPSATVLR
jgi:hypothetical protein